MTNLTENVRELARIVKEAGSMEIYRASMLMGKSWKTIERDYVPLLQYTDNNIVYNRVTRVFSLKSE